MKIAIAPNAFRGSLTSIEAVACIAQGLQASRLVCETVAMPLADGGDDTLEVWLGARDGQIVELEVVGPRGKPVTAAFGLSENIALIEMARASGVELLSFEERDPLQTTTYGTGQLIEAAIEHGATEILVGIGGSATVDGGAGCMQALGVKLLDGEGHDISYGGGALAQLSHIDLSASMLGDTSIRVLCDVDNPLLGSDGAAPVFGPQKGADEPMVRLLERNLAHYADVIENDLGIDIRSVPGSGAAGGLSAGLMAMAKASLVSGVKELIQSCGYGKTLASGNIDLLITGEGKLDSQTKGGKAPFGIAQEAAKHGVPVVALAGAVTAPISALQQWNIHAAWSIVPCVSTLEEAYENAAAWLTEAATNLGNILELKQNVG